jgi:integrase
MELIAYVRFWLESVKKLKVKPATFDRLITSADALECYTIAHKVIGAITAEDCESYVEEITHKGYALTTIKKQMLIVTAPLRYAYAHKQISYNPSIGLKPPSKANVQKAKKKVIAYNKSEQGKLRAVLDTRQREAYAAIDLMMETGLRPGEVLALDWEDICLERKRLQVSKTIVNLANKKQAYVQDSPKSETSNRAVPLSPRAISILTELRGKRTDQRAEYLFRNSDGGRLSYESLRYQCQLACREAGVEYHGLHVFRHTFATNQFYKGTNVKILSKILGHSETSVTYNIYIHLYGDGFDEMLDAVS